MPFDVGPLARGTLRRFHDEWEQGQHVVVSAPTGSGKTTLTRQLLNGRLLPPRNGHVVVFVFKLSPDSTITDEFRGWTRWKRWKKNPPINERRVLLWPDTKKLNMRQAVEHQKEVFTEALEALMKTGAWCVVCDEGLYATHSSYLNLSFEWALLQFMGRSSGLSCVTLTQRPAHLPVIVYSSATHAFVGQTRELVDQRRLAELGGAESSRNIGRHMASLGRQDFLWISTQSGGIERLNLSK